MVCSLGQLPKVAGTSIRPGTPAGTTIIYLTPAGTSQSDPAIALVRQLRKHRPAFTSRAPSTASAAATLLEQLVHPGFDPAQGAEANRRYVPRKSSMAIMEHRKRETPHRDPWIQIGISERRFYKIRAVR